VEGSVNVREPLRNWRIANETDRRRTCQRQPKSDHLFGRAVISIQLPSTERATVANFLFWWIERSL
jgi:hypothetical protein